MNTKLLTQLQILKITDSKPNFSALSREYDVDRRTIKKYFDGYHGKPKHHDKSSKLDEYRELIRKKLLIKGTTMTAVHEFLISEIDSKIGSYSNFRKYVKANHLRPKQYHKGHPRFETRYGYQAQVDWKEDLTIKNKLGEKFTMQIFDYKLGYSRYCHFVYKKDKTRQDVFDCLIDSFIATGGVPEEILFDNMASVIDMKANGKRRHVNQKMKAFSDDFHFRIRLAKPRHPYTKGKVETVNKFLAWLLPYQGDFETEDDLVEILKRINNRVNTKVCQATGVPPVLLFQKEKEYLQNLPSQKIIESYLSHDRQIKVQKDSLITYKNSRYSVSPEYIGKSVWIRNTENQLYIYYHTELIAVHNISEKRINYKEEHYHELLSKTIDNDMAVNEIAEANLRQMDMFL